MPPKRLSKKGKRGGRRFNPVGSPYKTQRGFNKAVNLEASAEYAPQLADIRSQGSQEERKHGTRGNEIESLYNSYGNELQRAFDQASGALNTLVAQSQGSSAADQAALRAALGASSGQQNQLAQTIGAGSSVPSSVGSSSTLLPAYGTAEAGKNAMGTSVAAMINEAAQRRSLPALGKIRSSEDEARRHFGERQRLSQARGNILQQVPGIRQQVRHGLLQDAREAQNLGFQQRLAGKQFGLDVRQQGLEEEKFKHQSAVDWTTLEQQQQQLDNQITNAGTEEEAAALEQKSKALQSGYSYVDSLFKGRPEQPGSSGKGQQKRFKQQSAQWDAAHNQGFTLPSQAYHALRTRFGLSDHDAAVILNSVGIPNFKAWVRRHRQGPVRPNKGKGNPKPATKRYPK